MIACKEINIMGYTVIYPKTRTIGVLAYKRNDAGMQVAVGQEEIYYETSIDLSQLNGLAKRAAHNKSGVANDGPLRVRLLEKRTIS